MKYYPVESLEKITEKIVELMPSLERFFLSDKNITENSKELSHYVPTELHKQRQEKFISLLKAKVGRLFSEEERGNIRVQDGLKGGVVDHHGILNHPVLVGVNVTPHFFKMFDRKTNGDILTFATGNVPLNDPFHRRGFMINGIKVNIFPKSDKDKVVYGLHKYDFRIVESLEKTHQWKFHASEVQKFLQGFQKNIDTIDFSMCQTLGDQITKLNFHLWPLLFSEKIRDNMSNLISIEYDDVVIEYLLYVLEHDKNSFVYRMLFDTAFRERLITYFEGRVGAWDEEKDKGTHFFWGLDENNEHLRMRLDGEMLKSTTSDFSVAWNLESLKDALHKKRILPGMLLKFALVLFYMGLKPFAGYGSANYLAVLQKNLSSFLEEEYPKDVEAMRSIIVNNVTSVPVLLQRNKGVIGNFFAFDIMRNGGISQEYFKKIDSIPLKYFMAPNLNTIYEYAFSLYGKGEKENINVSPEDYNSFFSGVI